MNDDETVGVAFTALVLGLLIMWLVWHLWATSKIDTVEQIEKFKIEKIADAHRLYNDQFSRSEK